MTDYAEEIRTAAQAILTAQAVDAGRPYKLVRDTWGWALGAGDFPALSVFLPRELMSPDGDANAAEPSFVHDCTIGICVTLGFERPEDLRQNLSDRVAAIYTALLQTTQFLQLFESIPRIERTTVFEREGETFVAEAQLNVTVRFRTDWPPVVPDDFESLAVTLKRPGQPTPTEPTLVLTVSQ